ncbi:MAG: hypothetical protein ABIP40_01805 [Bacteroidia bacterium]
MPEPEPIWNFFWDTHDYIHQSRSSLFSLDLYAPKPSIWFTPRPFTMPLLYKFIDGDPVKMFYFQKIIYASSAVLLTLSLNRFFSNYYFKLLNHITFLFFFTWWHIVGWSNNITSESISTSMFLLWLAAVIYYYRKNNFLSITLLLLSTLFLAFSRDTWPYILLFFFVLNFIGYLFRGNKRKYSNILFCLFSVVILLFQSYAVKIGQRTKTPVFNDLAIRISQNKEYIEWFKNEGAPQTAQLTEDFKGIDLRVIGGKERIYKRYADSTYLELFAWVAKNGKAVYQKFLVTHPAYFFLINENKQDLERIFVYNIEGYYQDPYKFFVNADNVFPLFSPLYAIIMSLFCLYFWIKKKKMFLLLPFILILMLIINIFINYNADTLEVERHMYMTRTISEFVSILCTYILVYYTFLLYSKRQKKTI